MISNLLASLNDDGADGNFWDNLRRKGHGYPEQDLLLAVLKDALVSYRNHLRRPNQTLQADRDWFFENESTGFSLLSRCALCSV